MPKKKARRTRSNSQLSESSRLLFGFFVFIAVFGLSLAVLLRFNVLDAGVNTPTAVGTNVYKGTTPCADCSGISTTLTLNSNPNTYTLQLVYMGKTTAPFVESGTWAIQPWKNDTAKSVYVLTPSNPKNGQTTMYEILSPTQIRQLDGDGNSIPTSLPFTLTKSN